MAKKQNHAEHISVYQRASAVLINQTTTQHFHGPRGGPAAVIRAIRIIRGPTLRLSAVPLPLSLPPQRTLASQSTSPSRPKISLVFHNHNDDN